LEFTLKLKLGKDGATDYSALCIYLIRAARRVEEFYIDRLGHGLKVPRFKQRAETIFKFNPDGSENLSTVVGALKIWPKENLSGRLLEHFPWLGTDEEVSGADTVEALQDFYDELIAEGN
jgi:hypothetical protein